MRQLTGVISDRGSKYAVSGAQPPEAFLQVFQLADQDEKDEARQATPA